MPSYQPLPSANLYLKINNSTFLTDTTCTFGAVIWQYQTITAISAQFLSAMCSGDLNIPVPSKLELSCLCVLIFYGRAFDSSDNILRFLRGILCRHWKIRVCTLLLYRMEPEPAALPDSPMQRNFTLMCQQRYKILWQRINISQWTHPYV